MKRDSSQGLILWYLRKMAGLSVRNLAKQIGRSSGWLSEVERGTGTGRLSESEFDRIVKHLDGDKHREMFRTWVANFKNAERVDRTLDGAVLKHIRIKKNLKLRAVAKLSGISVGFLSRIEGGSKNVSPNLRNQLMKVYGYNPSSFKNLSKDPMRSKAVPVIFKLKIILGKMDQAQLDAVFAFAQAITNRSLENCDAASLLTSIKQKEEI